MNIRIPLTLILLAVFLGGCSTLNTPTPDPLPDNTSAQQLAHVWKHWRATGKTSIKVDGDNTSASLNWLQSNDTFDIRLTGPLGQGGVDIFGNSGYVRIEAAGEAPIYSSDPEALMQERFGWSLPLDTVQWWLKGIPAPHSSYSGVTNAQEKLDKFEQNGWQVEYTQFHTNSPYFPRKIRFSRDNVSALMVIKEWQELNAQNVLLQD